MSKNRVIVESVVLAGRSQSVVARQYGVSQPWVSVLVTRWRQGGWEAVECRSRRPRHNPRAIPSVTVARIVGLRTELTAAGLDAGAHTIRAYLQREMDTPPAVSTIWNICKRHGLVTPQPRKRPRTSYLRFEADLPNECWQADFTHWRLADGTDTEILLFVDDHSRFLLSATAHRTVTGEIVHTMFCRAMDIHGMPASTLTDNGFVFTTRHRQGPNAFEIELLNRGIRQKNGKPNHPQTQGKVERLNQTLKRWLTAQPAAETTTQLQMNLDAFTEHYNTIRPHRSLAGRTPADTYTARAKATPNTRDGHWRIRDDIVWKTGSLTLRRGGKLHHIGIGTEHAGTPVRMLIHDLHITIINRETGQILRELQLDPEHNYQPLNRKPGPPKGSPRHGGRQKQTPPK